MMMKIISFGEDLEAALSDPWRRLYWKLILMKKGEAGIDEYNTFLWVKNTLKHDEDYSPNYLRN